MTAILAVRRNGKLCIGGDRAVTGYDSLSLLAYPKVVQFKGYAIGFCGLASAQASLRAMRPPRWTGKQDPQKWIETKLYQAMAKAGVDVESSEYLIAVGGRIFVIFENFASVEYAGDACGIGSGGQVSEAVARALLDATKLSARAIVERALGYCADCTPSVKAGPHGFDVFTI